MLGIDILCFLIVGAMWLFFPKGAKFLFVAPFVGIMAGGFAWGIAAMFWSALITLKVFACFLLVGVIISEIIAFLTE
jgi:hypothetical protein